MTFVIPRVELHKATRETESKCVSLNSQESCGPTRQEEYMGVGGF